MSRDKRNQAKIELLIKILESEGILSASESKAIKNGEDYQAMHSAASHSNGRPSVPDHSNGRNKRGNNAN